MSVVYCSVCTLPVEYCEFGKTFKKCKPALEAASPELYAQLYGQQTALSSLSQEKETQISQSLEKMQLKEERKQQRQQEELKHAKIVIKRIPRTKHKHIIAVANLEVLDMDLKKLAKQFASKFATGASVAKNAEKKDEVVIQGDVAEGVEALLLDILKDKGLEDVKIEHTLQRFTNKKK